MTSASLRIPCGRFRLVYRGRPLVMGILNVTPDSFSDGGRFRGAAQAIEHGVRMAAEGAALIDVGGESTRPGAAPVPADEEAKRVVPVIRALAKRVRVPLSIDTGKADVARRAIDAGASMVNDVSALRDPAMAGVVAKARVPVVLMHMRGEPRTMQRRPRYANVVHDVRSFLSDAMARAEAQGIPRARMLLDPGLGFGKTVAHNLRLIAELAAIAALGRPIVLGPSRKSFIGRVLGAPVDDRLAGTLACVAYGMLRGAHIVRVHDVKATAQWLRMWEAIARAATGDCCASSGGSSGSCG